jgi:hypothetical protein
MLTWVDSLSPAPSTALWAAIGISKNALLYDARIAFDQRMVVPDIDQGEPPTKPPRAGSTLRLDEFAIAPFLLDLIRSTFVAGWNQRRAAASARQDCRAVP